MEGDSGVWARLALAFPVYTFYAPLSHLYETDTDKQFARPYDYYNFIEKKVSVYHQLFKNTWSTARPNISEFSGQSQHTSP